MLQRQVNELTVTVEAQSREEASCRLWLTISAGTRDLIVVDRTIPLHDSNCAAMERTALEVATALAESLRYGRVDASIAAD